MLQIKGIDVSKYQGDIDFNKLKNSDIKFVIIRAGWGQNNIDGKFKRNITECNRLGIPCGVYWFSYALNPEQAKAEAKACLTAIAPYKLQYPVCFDYEYDSVTYSVKKGVNVTKESASAIAQAFLSEIERAGYWATNYTNLDFSKRYFSNYIMTKYDVWAARYTSTEKDIALTAGLWQYSSKGKVVGIKGNVDMDIAHKDYPTLIANKNKKTTGGGSNKTVLVPQKSDYTVPDMYKLVFDANYYLKKYADLQQAFGSTPTERQLFEHFYLFGMKEARVAIDTFDVTKYRKAYPDLNAAFGDDWSAYYVHYITAGAKEIAEGKRKGFM